jgi:transcription initiation factor TFIIB
MEKKTEEIVTNFLYEIIVFKLFSIIFLIMSEKETCPACGKKDIVYRRDTGEIICGTSGLVIGNFTSSGRERHFFTDEESEKRERVGSPLTELIHDKGLSTQISGDNKSLLGVKLSSSQKQSAYKLRYWDKVSKVKNSKDRNLSQALGEIKRAGGQGKLALPTNVLETASVIYQKALDEKVIRGRSILGMAAAATYAACRQCQTPKDLDDISEAFCISGDPKENRKIVGRCYRDLLKEILNYQPNPTKSDKYTTKLSEEFGIYGQTERVMYDIMNVAKNLRITDGKGPSSIPAGAAYIASVLTGNVKTQRDIAEKLNITEVTVRNNLKELNKRMDFIIHL